MRNLKIDYEGFRYKMWEHKWDIYINRFVKYDNILWEVNNRGVEAN